MLPLYIVIFQNEIKLMTSSTLPTLLQKGTIIPPKGASLDEKAQLKSIVAIDYIIVWLKQRISMFKGSYAKIKAQTISDKILILKSGTGSGKSTALIEHIYDEFIKLHKSIIITQPRILTVKDIPNDILKRRKDLELGVSIGYQTGISSKKPIKGIHFMTTGVLIQKFKQLTDEQIRNKYVVIIIDEIHLRDTYIDSILIQLKPFLKRNYDKPDCPMIILMSATIDPEPFFTFFDMNKTEQKKTSHFIEVVGKSFNIIEHWPTVDISNYVEYIMTTVKKIHTENNTDLPISSDILIFVPGLKVIKKIIAMLDKFNDKLGGVSDKPKAIGGFISSNDVTSATILTSDVNNWPDDDSDEEDVKGGTDKNIKYICPIILNSESYNKMGKNYFNLTADLSLINVQLSDGTIVNPSRRVIVATNVAETGVTIETLKYVIISGWAIVVEYVPYFSHNLIAIRPINQNEVVQQKGRAGRKSPGEVHYCFTKASFDSMRSLQLPEILRTSAARSILDIIILDTSANINRDVILQEKDKFQTLIDSVPLDLVSQDNPFNMRKTSMITFPSIENLNASLEKLHVLGYIDHNLNPTLTGLLAGYFNKLSLENMRMIFSGYAHGCYIIDLITIAAFIENGRFMQNFRQKYVPMNIFNTSERESQLNHTLLIQDEFIEYIFIWNAFISQLDKKMNIKSILAWCDQSNISYDELLSISNIRNEIIETMVSIGMNPYVSGLNIGLSYNLNKIIVRSISEGIAEIVKLKKCIYEGYKLNTCTYNDFLKQYVIDNGQIAVFVYSPLIKPLPHVEGILQNHPRSIIVQNIALKTADAYKGQYKYEASGAVSIIDGFYDIDTGFFEGV